MFEYLMSDEMSQVNGIVFLQDFTEVGPKLLSKLLNKDLQDFQKAWVVSSICKLGCPQVLKAVPIPVRVKPVHGAV